MSYRYQKRQGIDRETWDDCPRSFALILVEEGLVSEKYLLTAALNALSHQECQDMLDANELSPRFVIGDDDDDDE